MYRFLPIVVVFLNSNLSVPPNKNPEIEIVCRRKKKKEFSHQQIHHSGNIVSVNVFLGCIMRNSNFKFFFHPLFSVIRFNSSTCSLLFVPRFPRYKFIKLQLRCRWKKCHFLLRTRQLVKLFYNCLCTMGKSGQGTE